MFGYRRGPEHPPDHGDRGGYDSQEEEEVRHDDRPEVGDQDLESEASEPSSFDTSSESEDSDFIGYSPGSSEFLEPDKCMRLYNLVRSLEGELGGNQIFDVRLPQIVFCGNQSAGKSSIVEAISSVALPRNNNTTTRAKTEVRMIRNSSPSASFECQVLLHRQGKPEYKFGPKITRKGDVELQVQRAQKALLNPHREPAEFLSWSPFGSSSSSNSGPDEQQFTTDSVVLEITAPDVYNLTLIDLPGLISNDRNPDNITEVRRISEEVLREDNTIIVAAINCTEDENMAGIITLARQYDPLGKRTIGVLTKLDRVEVGNQARILEMISRTSANSTMAQLQLGYYAVRNRTQVELNDGVSFEDARRIEERFFEEENWLSGLREKGRCGVNALKRELSKLLEEKFRPLMEEIQNKCLRLRVEIQTKVEEIPEVEFRDFHEFKERVGDRVHSFVQRVTYDVNATGEDKSLWHKMFEEFRQFELNLYKQRPVFHSAYGDIVSVKLQGRQRVSTEYTAARSDLSHSCLRESQHWTFSKVEKIISLQRGQTAFYFDVFDAVRKIVRSHQQEWKTPTRACVDSVHRIFKEYLEETVAATFKGAFANVSRAICKIISEQLEIAKTEAYNMTVNRLFYMEAPVVFNRSVFTMREGDFLDALVTDYFPGTQGPEGYLKARENAISAFIRAIFDDISACDYSNLRKDIDMLVKEWKLLRAAFKHTLDPDFKQQIEKVTEEAQNLHQLALAPSLDMGKISTSVQSVLPTIMQILPTILPTSLRTELSFHGRAANILSHDDHSEISDSNATSHMVKDDLTPQTIEQVHKAMAGALSYYNIAHFRYLDMVTRSIYIILLADFTDNLGPALSKHLGLQSTSSVKPQVSERRWKKMVKEDIRVTEERERLMKLIRNLKTVAKEAWKIQHSDRR